MNDKRLPLPLRLVSDFFEFANWMRTIAIFVIALAFLGWGNTAGRLIGVGLLILTVWLARGIKKAFARQDTDL